MIMEKAILKGKKSIESHEPENGKEGSLGSKKKWGGCVTSCSKSKRAQRFKKKLRNRHNHK